VGRSTTLWMGQTLMGPVSRLPREPSRRGPGGVRFRRRLALRRRGFAVPARPLRALPERPPIEAKS